MNKIMNNDLAKIEKFLNDFFKEQYINPEFEVSYPVSTSHIVVVKAHIDWGDWKRDHLRYKYFIEKLGGKLDCSKVTQSDGSDCYSALHIHRFIKSNIMAYVNQTPKEVMKKINQRGKLA